VILASFYHLLLCAIKHVGVSSQSPKHPRRVAQTPVAQMVCRTNVRTLTQIMLKRIDTYAQLTAGEKTRYFLLRKRVVDC